MQQLFRSKSLAGIILTLLILSLFSINVSAQLPDVCQAPENIMANCTFDSGLDHWTPFLETGGANVSVLQGGGECHAPLCPAAYIVTEGHFIGGIYQQVPVQAGNSYYANIIWLVFDSLANDAAVHGQVGGIGRRIGIDPTGGTDSRSPNVVWSEDNWRNDCKICGVEHVSVTAQADVITVFLRIDDTWRVRAAEKGYAIPPSKDQFWIDDIGLKPLSEGEAVAPAPAATEPPPPTAPPEPSPTSTPESVAPEPANAVVQSEEEDIEVEAEASVDTPATSEETTAIAITEDATATPTETVENETTEISTIATVAPPPTLTATNTPPPTETTVARLQPTSQPVDPQPQQVASTLVESETEVAFSLLGIAGTTLCLGGVLILVMGLTFVGAAWLYRTGWGNQDDDDDDYDIDDDGYTAVEVEIID